MRPTAPLPSQLPSQALGVAVCVVALATGVAAGLGWRSVTGDAELLRQRRAEVAALSPGERDHLRRQYERFQQEDEEKRERLRTLDAELNASPDAAGLRAALRQYHAWLGTISPTERAALLRYAADPARRIERVQELSPLSVADANAVNQWLIACVKARWSRNAAFPLPSDAQILLFAQRMLEGRFGERAPFPKSARPEGLDEKDFARLAAELSEPRRAELQRKQGVPELRGVVASWLQRRRGSSETRGEFASPEELVRFYAEDLPSDVREKLLAMPLEQRNRELREEYRKAKRPAAKPSADRS